MKLEVLTNAGVKASLWTSKDFDGIRVQPQLNKFIVPSRDYTRHVEVPMVSHVSGLCMA